MDHTTTTTNGDRDWSSLPANVLATIAHHHLPLSDYIRFRSVCKPWSNSVPRNVVALPLLLLPGEGATLFVGDLDWWTTDADLEAECCKYGQVKEIKFFDEKTNGKSKGYCQVDFHDPLAAAACKDGMNGHLFNGRPCVVALEKNQVNNQQEAIAQKGGRGSRGPKGNMRNVRNGGVVLPPMPPPLMMPPGAMLVQGFDPMGAMGVGYGGFPAGAAGYGVWCCYGQNAYLVHA